MLHLLSWNSCFWSKDVISVARGVVCLGVFLTDYNTKEWSSYAWKPSRCIGSVAGGSVGLVGGSLLGHFSPRGGSWLSLSHSIGYFFYIFLRPYSGKPWKTMENHGKPWKTMENPHVWLSWNHPSWKILAFPGFLDSLGPANKLASQRGCRRPTTIFNIFVLKSIKITIITIINVHVDH